MPLSDDNSCHRQCYFSDRVDAPLVPFPGGNELPIFTMCAVDFYPAELLISIILIPRCRAPFGQYQESRPLAGSDVLSMRREFVSYSQPITLVPRGRAPFGQHQESRLLGRSTFLNMHRVIVLYSQPIRFVRLDSEHAPSDGKSVNRGLPVLDLPRGRDSWC